MEADTLISKINSIEGPEVEKNIFRFKCWTPKQRKIRLEKLYKSITFLEKKEVKKEVLNICYDENFFKRTKIDYSNPNIELIEIALLEYLMK